MANETESIETKRVRVFKANSLKFNDTKVKFKKDGRHYIRISKNVRYIKAQ